MEEWKSGKLVLPKLKGDDKAFLLTISHSALCKSQSWTVMLNFGLPEL